MLDSANAVLASMMTRASATTTGDFPFRNRPFIVISLRFLAQSRCEPILFRSWVSLPCRPTMNWNSHANLSASPPFLLLPQLQYDDLTRRPERFAGTAGTLDGCAFRSAEGRQASGSVVLQRRILIPVERLCRPLTQTSS